MASLISKPSRRSLSWTFQTPRQMQDWGRRFAKRLKPGDVVALVGELGAGKTTLVQGIAQALGYRRDITSPTFALVNEYRVSKGNVYHMDMYRLSAQELTSFPLEEYWGEGICLIEWADRVRARWPTETLEIRLQTVDENTRSAHMYKPSPLWRKRLRAALSGH